MIDWTAGACTAADCIQFCNHPALLEASKQGPHRVGRQLPPTTDSTATLGEIFTAEYTYNAAQQHIEEQVGALLEGIVAGLPPAYLVCMTVRSPSHNVVQDVKGQGLMPWLILMVGHLHKHSAWDFPHSVCCSNDTAILVACLHA